MFDELIHKVHDNIFDHTILFDVLKEYSKPRDKVTRLLNKKEIIQVKRGLYVFGKKWRKGSVRREILANLIYGPSYISMEYALSFYGMIPERVEAVTNITIKRKKEFSTPFGNYYYYHLNEKQYSIEVDLFTINQNEHFFIASREKALADLIAKQKKISLEIEMWDHLTENLRIEEDDLLKLSLSKLRQISQAYLNANVYLLYDTLKNRIS